MKIDSIKIENFKSIKSLDLPMKNINVLIGANGAGKSNFIQFFDLLNNIVGRNLQNYIAKNGGADNFMHFGRKNTESFTGSITFDKNNYWFKLEADDRVSFFFFIEMIKFYNSGEQNIAAANRETRLFEELNSTSHKEVLEGMINTMKKLRGYHFNDTTRNAMIKQYCDINDNRYLRYDGANLAAFLYKLSIKHIEYFNRIEKTIKIIAPFFERFQLEPHELNRNSLLLEWKHEGTDKYFNASHFSDGTLRTICLITLLLQPEPPDTIVIDEPEIGLHPAALELLAGLIKSVAAGGKQVICSTQSVTFLDNFEPEDIIVVDREENASTFKRLNEEDLKQWLEDYSIGELWDKNVLGGRP